jgi:hypothetical protein
LQVTRTTISLSLQNAEGLFPQSSQLLIARSFARTEPVENNPAYSLLVSDLLSLPIIKYWLRSVENEKNKPPNDSIFGSRPACTTTKNG